MKKKIEDSGTANVWPGAGATVYTLTATYGTCTRTAIVQVP